MIRRATFWALGTGLVLAVGTPLYLASAAPSLAGYLRHPVIVVGQGVPFLLCAALWLPQRAPEAARVALVVAGLMLVATVAIDAPILWRPGARGGDMIGLAFMAIAAALSAFCLVASAAGGLLLWWRRRAG